MPKQGLDIGFTQTWFQSQIVFSTLKLFVNICALYLQCTMIMVKDGSGQGAAFVAAVEYKPS